MMAEQAGAGSIPEHHYSYQINGGHRFKSELDRGDWRLLFFGLELKFNQLCFLSTREFANPETEQLARIACAFFLC